MDFNIRAISVGEGVTADTHVSIEHMLGKEVEFRSGLSVIVNLPKAAEDFDSLEEPEKSLSALLRWSRCFKYPANDGEGMHILATARSDRDLEFIRVNMLQPKARKGPRLPVRFLSSAVMSYDECATWLIGLVHERALNSDFARRWVILQRPRVNREKPIRIAWVGPEVRAGVDLKRRLSAIGTVYGADIFAIAPISYRDVTANLRALLPFDAAFICRSFAQQITPEAIPDAIPADLIYECDATAPPELETETRAWAEIVWRELEQRKEGPQSEDDMLLQTMLAGMVSHSKIGQFSHCDKATVLTRVRARHLNVPRAEGILDRNSEAYSENGENKSIFLYKEHHDGRQYFLNPKMMKRVRAILSKEETPEHTIGA